MSIETTHLEQGRRATDHAANDLAHHIERPLRRAALKLRASRLDAMLCWERECSDAEIQRQQKQIANLQRKLRDMQEDATVQDHRIAALENTNTEWLLITDLQHGDDVIDLAAD